MARFDADYVPASAMTIFAHPDDAEFGVGGTLAKWASAGCRITMVLITHGQVGTHDPEHSRESLAATRAQEQRAAAEELGVEEVVFLDHGDCEVLPSLELRRDLVRVIRAHKPEVVISGDPEMWFIGRGYINHPDHRAAAAAVLAAVFPCAEMALLWPELGLSHKVQAVYITMTSRADTWVDIGGTLEVKLAALRRHVSQMGEWDPSQMVRGWSMEEAKAARKKVAKVKDRAGKGKKGKAGRTDAEPETRRPELSIASGKAAYVEGFKVMVLVEDAPVVEEG